MSDEELYPIEKILDSTMVNGKMEYYVKWENHDETENTWEPRSNLVTDDVFIEYEKNQIEQMTSSARPKRKSNSKYAKKDSIKSLIKKPVSSTRSKTPLGDKAKSSIKKPVSSTHPKKDTISKQGKKTAPLKSVLSSTPLSDKAKRLTEKTTPSDGPKQVKKKDSESNQIKPQIEKPFFFNRSEKAKTQIEKPPSSDRKRRFSTKKPNPALQMVGKHQDAKKKKVPTYRAEEEEITAIHGCQKKADGSVWIICSFEDDENDLEFTPYSVIYEHHPKALLTYFYARIVFAHAENNP